MAQTPYQQQAGNSYKHISTQTTTVVKATGGVLRKVMVNSATNGAAVTFYDNASAASGTVIAIYGLGSITTPQTAVEYNLTFTNGLTVLTATQNADITITYT